MEKKLKYGLAGILSTAVIMGSALSAGAADIDVYAEGAYTDTDLVVYIYADINTTDPLVSAGVSLIYDTAKLTFASATKNESVWYFGQPGSTYDYIDPDDSAATGKASFLLGKIDTNNPTEGVGPATRVELGHVVFNRTDAGADPGTDPEGYFAASLDLGNNNGTYANFVTNGASTPDPVVVETEGTVDMSNVVIRERGDANGDGVINVQDILRAKSYIGSDNYPVYVDCNGDEGISVQDILCIKSKMQ